MKLVDKVQEALRQSGEGEFDNHPIDAFNNGISECISYLERNNLINKSSETTNEEPKNLCKCQMHNKELCKDRCLFDS